MIEAFRMGGCEAVKAALFGVLLVAASSGCARPPRPQVMSEVERTREGPAALDAKQTAPQAYARAEQFRKRAEAAYESDDLASAQIWSEQALAAYLRATVEARLTRAENGLAQARVLEKQQAERLAQLEGEQQRVAAEAADLELRFKVARDAEPLAASAPASAEREQARLAAAKALLSQAKLLCLSARLLEPNREGLQPLIGKLGELSSKLGTPPVPIDDAISVRSSCLRELTLARRPATQKAPEAGVTDALLSDLSNASLLPFRDDRGVVVTLRGLFSTKDQLSPDGTTKLDLLGKVAKAHPEFPLLAVVHGARGNATAADAAQATAVAEALKKAGASRVETDAAGGAEPVLDPARPGASERNTRVEIVFVSPSSS